MSSKLLLPDFYKVPEKEPDIPLKDRLPQPTGWRPCYAVQVGQTERWGYIPDDVVEREALATVVSYVIRVRPLAYKDKDKFGDGDPV